MKRSTPPPVAGKPELSVVIPVFREADAVASVLETWTSMLDRLEIDYELLVYDDGSGDATPEVLRQCAHESPRMKIETHANRGHGPTIHRGYRESRGRWVFQLDSDDEISAEHFVRLWEHRDAYDLLVGSRDPAGQLLARRLVSTVSSMTVRVCFGRGVRDVNAPYRLMRGTRLRELLPLVPASAFAPNVILSGLFVRAGYRMVEFPVPRRPAEQRRSTLGGVRLWRGAVRSFLETLSVSITTRRLS